MCWFIYATEQLVSCSTNVLVASRALPLDPEIQVSSKAAVALVFGNIYNNVDDNVRKGQVLVCNAVAIE